MVSFSKLLDQGLRHASCQDVYHPGRSCSTFHFKNSLGFLTTVMKYFLPLVIVRVLTKGKNLRIRDVLMYYVETFVTAYFIAQSVPIAMCLTRALSGGFDAVNIIYIPHTIVSWPVFFTTDRVAHLFGTSVFQVMLEALIRSEKAAVLRTLHRSIPVQTALFMMCSASILHASQTYGLKFFWFVKAVRSPRLHETNKCAHDGACLRFCIDEFGKILLFSIPLDLYKTISGSSSKSTNLKSELTKKFLRLDLPTTLFLLSYTGIYRLSSCLLTRLVDGNPQVKHALAAFFGGISFCFSPRLTMLCYGVAICIEILWKLFQRHEFESDSKLVKFLETIPFNRLFVFLSTGMMVHLFIFRAGLLSQLGVAIISAFTGNQSHIIRKDVHKFFAYLDKSREFKSYI